MKRKIECKDNGGITNLCAQTITAVGLVKGRGAYFLQTTWLLLSYKVVFVSYINNKYNGVNLGNLPGIIGVVL